MKYFFLLIASGYVLASCNTNDAKSAQTTTLDSATKINAMADTANYTTIQWLDSTHQNMGKIPKGKSVEVSWRLKNSGTTPLIIQGVQPGCGCTVAEKPEKPIMPGEESVIKGTFNSNGQSEGEHRKSISVVANTKNTNYHQLSFSVEVVKN